MCEREKIKLNNARKCYDFLFFNVISFILLVFIYLFILQMDKRSVLVDALAYLSSIHEEIERIKKEEPKHIHNSYVQAPTNTTLQPQRVIESQTQKPRPKSQILEVKFLDLISNLLERKFSSVCGPLL